jgi:TPP-dependent pyruvate/acetoin dehydrogenase alpha subunit
MLNALIRIFRQTAFNHFFELKIAEFHKAKKISIPIYLSIGTEHLPAVFAEVNKEWVVFPQHRCHSYFLSFAGDPLGLMKELLGRPDGCNGGMGGSASISIKNRIFGHDGLLGSNLPIGIGYAQASGKPTLVHIGDAGIEEDYALASLGYAASKKCPVMVIVEDNDLSILTDKKTRRSWEIVPVAKSFGVEAIEIEDDPEVIYNTVQEYKSKLPALINIKVCRHLWHAGSGMDGVPEWDRYEMFKRSLMERGVDVGKIEQEAIEQIEEMVNHTSEGV